MKTMYNMMMEKVLRRSNGAKFKYDILKQKFQKNGEVSKMCLARTSSSEKNLKTLKEVYWNRLIIANISKVMHNIQYMWPKAWTR